MQKKVLFISALIILIISIFFYTHSNPLKNKDKPQTITVSAQPVRQKNVTAYLDTIGTVEAYATVNLTSLVDGEILKIDFTEGQTVRQRQLLFVIDPRPFQIQLQQAQANVAKDQAQLKNAQLILQRYAKLIKQGYVAQQDYDQNRANADALAATVKADEAAIANAQLQLSYTQITAPISGRTGAALVTVGNLIKTAANTSLVTINQIQPIYVTFTAPQHYLHLIQTAQTAAPLTITAHIEKSAINEQGQLTFINNAIDTTTGTIQLKATFANTDQLLWPGQFVKVRLPLHQLNNALIVPNQAVQVGQQGTYVFAVRNHQAFIQPVKTGVQVQEGTVIETGLKPGDIVVTDGQFLLTDGASVNIENLK